jgi:hypothetical protein
MTFVTGASGVACVHLRFVKSPPNYCFVEHLTRTISWTFVFGAIAALAYTNFKPAFSEFAGAEVMEEQVRGTMMAKEAKPATPEMPRPESIDCETSLETEPDVCAAPAP